MITLIQRLNSNPSVHAILLQLPLDSENSIDADKCTNTIAVYKVNIIILYHSLCQLSQREEGEGSDGVCFRLLSLLYWTMLNLGSWISDFALITFAT